MALVAGVKNSRVAGSAAQVDMETIGDACVLEAVASACQQRARAVGMEIRHGLTSLASVSVTAPLLGLIGTVYGITNSFTALEGPAPLEFLKSPKRFQSRWSPQRWVCSWRYSLWAYRYLSDCEARFRQEMDGQSIDLVNNLILHIRRSGNTQPLYFGEKSKSHLSGARKVSILAESSTDAPPLLFNRTYPNGLLELVWPRLRSNLDAEPCSREASGSHALLEH